MIASVFSVFAMGIIIANWAILSSHKRSNVMIGLPAVLIVLFFLHVLIKTAALIISSFSSFYYSDILDTSICNQATHNEHKNKLFPIWY